MPTNTAAGAVTTPTPATQRTNDSGMHLPQTPSSVKVSHRVLNEARALGVWGSSFTRLERLLISQCHRAPLELDNAELAARVAAIRECDSVLARQRELPGGSL
jgi:hypothetical protein